MGSVSATPVRISVFLAVGRIDEGKEGQLGRMVSIDRDEMSKNDDEDKIS